MRCQKWPLVQNHIPQCLQRQNIKKIQVVNISVSATVVQLNRTDTKARWLEFQLGVESGAYRSNTGRNDCHTLFYRSKLPYPWQWLKTPNEFSLQTLYGRLKLWTYPTGDSCSICGLHNQLLMSFSMHWYILTLFLSSVDTAVMECKLNFGGIGNTKKYPPTVGRTCFSF